MFLLILHKKIYICYPIQYILNQIVKYKCIFKKGALEKSWDSNLYEYNLLLKSVALFIIKNDKKERAR